MSHAVKAVSVVGRLVESLSAVSDATRLRILAVLAAAGRLCVCELAESLRLPHYSISRHVNMLKRVGLLDSRREGTYVFYSIVRSAGAALIEPVLRQLASVNGTDVVLAEDASRLRGIIRLRDTEDSLTAYCEAVEAGRAARVTDEIVELSERARLGRSPGR